MKTKSKLVLGLSILSAATLAAGATSTFAWFTATSASSISNRVREDAVAAEAKRYDVGKSINVISDFASKTVGTDKKTSGNLPTFAQGSYTEQASYAADTVFYEKYGDHYIVKSGVTADNFAASKEAAPGKTLYKATTAPKFEDVELSDADGKTMAYTAGGLVDVSGQVHKDITGVATWVIQLDTLAKSDLAMLEHDQVVTLTLGKVANIKVYADKPDSDGEYVDCGGIVFQLTIAEDGTYSATKKVGAGEATAINETTEGNGIWNIDFYYGRSSSTDNDGETATNYAGDAVKVTGTLANRGE